MLVAECERRIIGSLSLVPDEGAYELAMFVAAEERGRGAGRGLIHAAIAWALAHNAPMIRLTVFAHNDAALRLYTAAGFEVVERRPSRVARVNGEIWQVIDMEKRL